ncbi:hypothetical protein [Cellvibrio sp. UBA7661]
MKKSIFSECLAIKRIIICCFCVVADDEETNKKTPAKMLAF